MQFEVTILGSNGAVAAYERYPSSQALHYNGQTFLIDCGEGTQFRMNKFGIRPGRLDHIFISHLHGDHYFGLAGLLTTFNLNWRQQPLHVYAPRGLEEIIKLQFTYADTKLKFDLHFHPIDTAAHAVIYEDEHLTVETIPLVHRIPTAGFLFREKKLLRKIIAEKMAEYQIPYAQIPLIRQGSDFVTSDGNVIPNSELTTDPTPARSYAYCSDTLYTESILDIIQHVDLLYHETTFSQLHEARATETFHTTTTQAATLALKAGVKKLLIGHFSARYEDLNALLAECRSIFPNTYLAEEGATFIVGEAISEIAVHP
ncbi:MAG: ribonuclease Z [Chitinophagales bacterium]|nr:ribonuclease Z [Chitinophagales bacterium]MDW8419653.1 ribonuclease Z [Chitinophagales bacterium]